MISRGMKSTLGERPFPRFALVGAALAVLGSVVAAGASRLGAAGSWHDSAPTLAALDLRFADLSDGSVVITEDRTGRVVGTIAPGTNGFLRATVRGLVSERRRESAGPALPFRLAAHADGQITLDDPATGRQLDLIAFGPTNAAAFARLLPGTVGPVPPPMP